MPDKRDNIKIFGFITKRDIAEVAFLHSRIINDFGLHWFIFDWKLLIKVDDAV